MEKKMIDIGDLKQKLHNGIVRVTFTKVNGEERIMDCTLMESLIPSTDLHEGSARKHSDEVQPVWDTEKAAWRSFRIDSVISY
jgi:hypothetical protein